jgi:hypothetical protein
MAFRTGMEEEYQLQMGFDDLEKICKYPAPAIFLK